MVSAGEFRFQFCNFLLRCSVYIVYPAVLSCSNLKLHQTSAVKNIFKEEKIMLQLTFNPGLTLTAFRTTRPSLPVYKLVWLLLTTFLLQGVESTVLASFQNDQASSKKLNFSRWGAGERQQAILSSNVFTSVYGHNHKATLSRCWNNQEQLIPTGSILFISVFNYCLGW